MCVPCVLVIVAGCGPARLDETRTYELDPGGVHAQSIELSAQPKPQTMKVEYDSSAAEVDVGLFKAADATNFESADMTKAMKAETGKTSGSFTVEVPENTATTLVVGNPKGKTSVKVHITNR